MQVNRKLWLTGMIVLVCMRLRAQSEADVVSYINTYKGIAISEMQRTGVPAAITLAQGIHESQAGTSDLVKRSNNHFGIKCKDEWTGDRVYHDDDARGECFRRYPHPEDSYRDHSDFLKNRPYYASLFTLDPTDYVAWSNGLRKAGYATNPKYAQILIKLIEDYRLEQYTLIAMGKEKASDEVVLQAPGAVSMPLQDTVGRVVGKPERVHPDAGAYPEGEFMINKARVIYAKGGTSLLAIADQYGISLPKLLDFNDLKEEDVLADDQLVFLQRKRKVGESGFHIVREGETLYDICQSEGVRYQDLLEMNHLVSGDEPAAGEKVYLQGKAPGRPLLVKQ